MLLGEALVVLGVGPTTPWADVRAAYRTLIRTTHPDVAGADHSADAARLNEALRVVRTAVVAGDHPVTATPRAPVASPPVGVELVHDDGLALVAPPDEVFDRLHAALHTVGAVTYVDPDAGLLECLLELVAHHPSRLTVSLQGRGATTEAFFTLESDDAATAPPLPAVVRLLADRLRAM